ncbi:hypothetical protein W04_3233 [Pseudoalteromonas sp. SW0106-04]|nr:hypothetical protein W04_3233 [Pseudoalteromonas sp. SW0106-04]
MGDSDIASFIVTLTIKGLCLFSLINAANTDTKKARAGL